MAETAPPVGGASQIKREIEATRSFVERSERQLYDAQQKLRYLEAELAALPPEMEDDFEPYTFLIVEHAMGGVRYFHKNQQGEWWYAGQGNTPHPVSWDVVRSHTFDNAERIRRTVSMVTHMEVLS